MVQSDIPNYELAVIGSGIAGMAAALYAASRNISTILIGDTGSFHLISGMLDLFRLNPLKSRTKWENPWHGIEQLIREVPHHPYAKMHRDDLEGAFKEFTEFLADAGLPYQCADQRNSQLLTAVGTLKSSYYIPKTMWSGVKAVQEKAPCLLIDFEGMKEYSANQIRIILGENWPGLRSARVAFPGLSANEVYGEHIARSLDVKAHRLALAKRIKPLLKGVQYVGAPAVLGLYKSSEVIRDLEEILGVSFFEIPTLPVSVHGIRMTEAFGQKLPAMGVQQYWQKRVLSAKINTEKDFTLEIGKISPELTIKAQNVILASGRFLSKGLIAERGTIKEPLFDLPLTYPEKRSLWHEKDFFNPHGHQINRAGIEVDCTFHPIDTQGKIIDERLFAVGAILAHQDWKREKCGTGMAIGSAYRAVKEIEKHNTLKQL
jgi:glycerol-3-phosphate dehydrogenase subunit B